MTKNDVFVANKYYDCHQHPGIPGSALEAGAPQSLPPLLDRPVYKFSELPLQQDSTELMSSSTERKARPDLTSQAAHSWEVSHVLMSFYFPCGLTDKISGLLLCAHIFQVTVQECTFGQTHCNSYMTILIRNQRDDVSECSSYLCLLWICALLMWALFPTPWRKSWVVHSNHMILWISMTCNTNYCIFVIKQRPIWLMWCCFDASRLTSFCLSAVCSHGNPGQTQVLTPNWPLEEDREPKSQAKAVHHGCCCCLHLALPPSLPCLAYRRTAGGCGQPIQALVQIKYLLA